jgi:hypothetical protein
MSLLTQRFYAGVQSKLAKGSDLANFFIYYLTVELDLPTATVSAVKKCYEDCDLHAPSWLGPYFSAGLRSKPRRFIKKNGGYRLERNLREQIAAQIDQAPSDTANDENKGLAGIEYVGIAGGSEDCRNALLMRLQFGERIKSTRILTYGNSHCLLLANELDDLIAIKSGFASGYCGEGPQAFSFVLQLLELHGAEIEEFEVDAIMIDRLDTSALTLSDLDGLKTIKPVRPARYHKYIDEKDCDRGRDGSLWQDFPPVVPYAIIDERIMDLAISFWRDPDDRLLKGYRRLEDLLRKRTNVDEHGTKLFSQVFMGANPKLSWSNMDQSERIGRSNLYAGAYMAHRNPRAHRELKAYQDAQLSEFLLLNHLYRLEREAVYISV